MAFVHISQCERVHREFEVPEKRFGQMFNFGFLPGGSARVELSSSSETAQLAFLLCTEEDHYQLNYVCSAIQSNISMPTCEVLKLFTHSLTADVTVAAYGTYYFDLANCNTFAIANLSFTAHTVNPGNEELSSAIIPVPMMFIAFTILWLAVLVACIVDALRFRAFGCGARLALILLAVIKLVACFVACAEVEFRSLYGTVDYELELTSNVIVAVLRASALTLAVALSSGWLLLTMKPLKPLLLIVLFCGVAATSICAYVLSSGLMQLFVEFISIALLIGSCLWAVRNTNFNLYRFTTWVPTTVRRRVPGAVSGSETDTGSESSSSSSSLSSDDGERGRRRAVTNGALLNEPLAVPAAATTVSAATTAVDDAAVPLVDAAVIPVGQVDRGNRDGDDNEDDAVQLNAGVAVAAPVRRRRRIPAAVEWVEVRPGERRAVLVRVALYTALRRALLMLMGGAGIVLCASLLLAHSEDTWLVSTVTETWLILVFIEMWVALRVIKSDILERPPIDDADADDLLAEVDRNARR